MIERINLVYEYESPLGPIFPSLDRKDMPEAFLSILNNFESLDNQILKANKINYNGVESHYSHLMNLLKAYKEKYKHNPEKVRLEYVHVDDIEEKENELNFLMIQSCHFYTIENEISNKFLDLSFLSQRTLEYLRKSKNFYLWIVDDKEGSYGFEPNFSKNILDFIKNNNIGREKIIFSNCNNFIDTTITYINSFPINPYILQGSLDVNLDSNGNEKTAPTLVDVNNIKNDIRPLKFLCYNRNSSRLHRLLLVSKLLKDDILEDSLVSLYENEYFNDINKETLFYDFEGLSFSHIDITWMKKVLTDIYPLQLDFDDQQKAAQSDNFLSEKTHYLKTYFSLVTETSISNEWSFITEKCIRPMIGLHPFIVFGNPLTLDILKKHGFKTFDTIIDESYDSEFDTNKRFEMAYEEVTKLNKLSKEELHEKYYSILDILEHNKNLIRKFAHNDSVIENTIENLIKCVSSEKNFLL